MSNVEREAEEAARRFQAMSDEEFERAVVGSIRRPKTTQIALRVPEDVLDRAKREASARGVPYQGLMKALIVVGLDRMEGRAS